MRQLCREFVVAKTRAIEEQERDVALAWYTANLVRAQKIPSLKELLRQLRPQRKQTRREQHAIVHQLSAQLGKPLKRVRLVHKERSVG